MVTVFAHRGLGFGKCENSVEAVRAALTAGCGVEVDVQVAKDDVLVVVHDATLMRIAGENERVVNVASDELRQRGVPLLEEVLRCVQETRAECLLAALHIKDESQPRILERVASLIARFALQQRCFVFDVSLRGVRRVKQLDPSLRVGVSVAERKYTSTVYPWGTVKGCAQAEIVWWDEWRGGLFTAKNFQKLKNEGKIVYAVSPELHRAHQHPKGKDLSVIRAVWSDLLEWGVHGICTDFPTELQQWVKQHP